MPEHIQSELLFERCYTDLNLDTCTFQHPAIATRLRRNKKVGIDGCTFEVLSALADDQLDDLRTKSLEAKLVPASWKVMPTTVLGKSHKRELTSNRLIASSAATHKWYLKNLSMQIFSYVRDRILPNYLGIRPGDSILHMTAYAGQVLCKMNEWGINGVIGKADISRAFATAPVSAVISACEHFGVPIAWCKAVECELRGNFLVLHHLGVCLGVVAMHRGMVEGSTFSPLAFGIFSCYLMLQLMGHESFMQHQLILPPASNCPSIRLAPCAYFDDWLFLCDGPKGFQGALDVFGTLLGTYDMQLATEPGKIAFVGRGCSGASVYYGGTQVIQSEFLKIVGCTLDASGNAYTALLYREVAAAANWSKFCRTVNVKNLDIPNYCKCVSAIYTSTLVHGLAGFAFDNSFAAKVQSAVSRIGIGAVRLRVPQAPTIEHAHLRRRREFKELKRAGTMRDPLKLIASQRISLHKPPPHLQSVLAYRNLDWARSLTLQSRPARTRGGIILDLGAQLHGEVDDFDKSKHFAVQAWAIRYGASGLWN